MCRTIFFLGQLFFFVFFFSCSNEENVKEVRYYNGEIRHSIHSCSAPFNVRFHYTHLGGFDVAYAFYWDFGDGHKAKGNGVSHVFEKSGTYNIRKEFHLEDEISITNYTLTLSDEGYSPVSDFTVDLWREIRVGQEINFNNLSEYSTEFLWRFGDEDKSISTKRHPSFAYSEPGTYIVTLESSCGGKVDTSYSEEIVVLPYGDLRIKNVKLLNKDPDDKFVDLSEDVLFSSVYFEVKIDSDHEYNSSIKEEVTSLPIEWEKGKNLFFSDGNELSFEFYLENTHEKKSLGVIKQSYLSFKEKSFPTVLKLSEGELEIELELSWY